MSRARISPSALVANVVCAISAAATISAAGVAVSAAPAQAAFGVEEQNFEAGTCNTPSCTYASVEKDHSEAFTQAAGHPPDGITSFELNHTTGLLGEEPEGDIKRVRVDIPPGLAADPQALASCPIEDFQKNACEPDTQVGTNELTVFDGIDDLTITGDVYNLQQPPGLPLDFGIDVSVEPLVNVHIYLEGHDSWSTDYHEYFEINDIPREGEVGGLKVPLAVLKSKLVFFGTAGEGDFLTLPSTCSTTTTSHLEVESWEGQVSSTQTHTPLGVEGCEKVPFGLTASPFGPTASVTPEPAAGQSDEPDGATIDVKATQHPGADEINTADVQTANVTLPEGMTLDPSAARNLQACTASQIGIGSEAPVACPAASKVGTVAIETDLPAGSLAGNVYLGSPGGGPITGPPYTIYLDAESPYGVSVRLAGKVQPNPQTGRLEGTFASDPQLPFSELLIHFDGGPQAPLANPLSCGAGALEFMFTPYTGEAPAVGSSPFAAAGCSTPLSFSLAQSTQESSTTASSYTSYTFDLRREDGQQYLADVKTVLPAGLLGAIPSVALCGEPQAGQGTCPPSSRIGTATVTVGAGPEPFPFSGAVYLTGPYDGSPYGLSIPVAATAGPFDLGTIVTQAGIDVDPHSGRVMVSSGLPTIVGGIPLRLRNVSVSVDRPNFLFNPTSCGPLASESTLTSTLGAIQSLASPFQVSDCDALPFKPSFKASTAAHTSKADGASLRVTLTQGVHQANVHSVSVALPSHLPSRLSTLQKACPEGTYAADPTACPSGSKVGSATVTTPVLPGKLTGPAYLVSHGGAAFPDLDLLLEGDGVHVILTGNTRIAKGITTSTFPSIPDVPVSTFVLSLPEGPNSALAADGNLCAKKLLMPTTIAAQSGLQVRQDTRISVPGCPHPAARRVRIISHRIARHTLVLRVRTTVAGRMHAGGGSFATVVRRLGAPSTVTLRIPLSRTGLHELRAHRRLKVRVRVRVTPARRGQSSATASLTVTFGR